MEEKVFFDDSGIRYELCEEPLPKDSGILHFSDGFH
jgi:hypothetical protein